MFQRKMTLIWIMMVSSTLAVIDSPPAGTQSSIDHGSPVCPSTCETCVSKTLCMLCKTTYYGPACQLDCDCNGKGCNKVTGVCPPDCVDGRWGEGCKLECPVFGCKKCDSSTGQCLHCLDNLFLGDGFCFVWLPPHTTRSTKLHIPTNLTETDASCVTTDKEVVTCRIGYSIYIYIAIVAFIAILFHKPVNRLMRVIIRRIYGKFHEANLSRQVGNDVRIKMMPIQCEDDLPKKQTDEIDKDSDTDNQQLGVIGRDYSC